MDKDMMWDELLSMDVEEQTLEIVAAINGYSRKTMEDVLYAHTGYRTFDQLEYDKRETLPNTFECGTLKT